MWTNIYVEPIGIMLFILQAKADGHPVKHAALYSMLHPRKDGSAVNEVVKEKMVSVRNICHYFM